MRRRRKKKKINESHAAARMLQRTGASFWELKRAISEERFRVLVKQSNTRNLCRTFMKSGEAVYFIYNKQRGSIITVLTKVQAASHFPEGCLPGPGPEERQ